MGEAEQASALWRDAWEPSSFVGIIGLQADKATGQETLAISCEEVAAEHGQDARILDDGRTVGVGVGDRVSFGVVLPPGKRAVPVAVNVWRVPEKRRKKDADADLWESWATNSEGFDYSSSSAPKKKKKGVDGEKASKKEKEPDPTETALQGVVQSQSANTGHFFLQCAATFAKFNSNVIVYYDTMPEGIEVGDAVIFRASAPSRIDGPPSAWKVKKASGEVADSIKERCREERKAQKGKGKGKDGKGEGKSGGYKGKRPVISMTGIVKKTSAITGRHFIFCQDISDVCGQDAQIPPDAMPEDVELKCGDRIAFDVEEPDETRLACPLAFNVRLLSGKAAAKRKHVSSGGDGEEEEEVELEEDDGVAEDPDVEADEMADAEMDAGRLKADVPEEEEEDDGDGEEEGATDGDPDTVDGWATAQSRLFKGLSKLPEGWIRMRSKSSGLIYFYNVDTGESSPNEPGSKSRTDAVERADAKASVTQPETVDEWVAAQRELFPGLPALPRGWIRMRSKSTGLTFYYNVDSGESSPNEPRK